MTSSERSWLTAISMLALTVVFREALTFVRFLRADAGFSDFFTLAGLLSVTLYAWFTPGSLARSVEGGVPEVRDFVLRKIYGLSIAVLCAVQLGLTFVHPLRTLR